MAQLVTTTNQSPSQLVQNVLLGQGVDVMNITFSGASQSIGYFNGTNTTLGFSEGILITTGTVQNVANGPHGPNDRDNATINNNAGGYNRLSQLVGGTQTYNAAVLEFDFIPYSDTVTFRYIFGSEEYREYVNTEFNDVFAFFISGPGYTGYQNIATLPNNTPVTINNINDGYINNGQYVPQCNNCQYYVHNGNGSQSPYNVNPKYIQYDGFTKPLEAVAKVQCGKKYHLLIA
ncbi:MAG: choice-of-anchor L domain-containing protein, partial [Flavobacteriia bacterium]|nr:choice-of-anchor L domain-containing protein [Flavobacteriia bacterium]